MSKSIWILILVALTSVLVTPQLVADTYDVKSLVEIKVFDQQQVVFLNRYGIEIVGRSGDTWRALVVDDEIEMLQAQGLHVKVLHQEMAADRQLWSEAKAANAYYTASPFNILNPPTGSLMAHLLELHQAHPNVTRLHNIGDTSSGTYDIIAMQVSKNPDTVEREPKMRIYANIHGDEKGALMVAVDVLDWILDNYPADPIAAKLVDEAELWFIPMGNPEGVASFSRYNDNNVDLNRNFSGPEGC
ncbi:MAG: DUF2817 domain-containing protein, partial [bacterium]|nr:DUF2817 domain-containing protein [bacterium]